MKGYLLSLPERVLRTAIGMGAGAVHGAGELALPDGIRESQLYRNLVDSTLRFLIEQVGGVQGVYDTDGALPADFVARRATGNAIEVLGIVAFRASPVWVLAALADLSGLGRQLIPEIADALKAQGLLDDDAEFTGVDQLLDGLERTSARLASTVNAPPLDVATLRAEWTALRADAQRLPAASLPSAESVRDVWQQLKQTAGTHDRSVFETSSALAVSAARALPDRVKWVASSARVGATRVGQVFGAALLDHYRETLGEIRDTGYVTWATDQLRPYVRASVRQFAPSHQSWTERLMAKWQRRRERR